MLGIKSDGQGINVWEKRNEAKLAGKLGREILMQNGKDRPTIYIS
jgi:hypothetical protein